MSAKKPFYLGHCSLALALILGACGGGGASPTTPGSSSGTLVGVKTALGTVTVNTAGCANVDLAAVERHFNRDLDKACQKKMGIRNLDASGLILECNRDHQYIGQYFPPQRIVFAKEQVLRHERDHWAARSLGISCWAEVDHTVDFCCQPL